MRYHYKIPEEWEAKHAVRYEISDHPIASACTLYLIDNKGIGLIQQYSGANKSTYWSDIYPFLVDDIFNQENFMSFFEKFSSAADENGWYPLIPVRKIMWALKMKPLKKERWETTFDHIPV